VAYGPNYPDLFRRAAEVIDKIMRGANPGDIPVEQPTKFNLVIALKTAKVVDLTVPNDRSCSPTRWSNKRSLMSLLAHRVISRSIVL
jgi:ABC-type uncharacterized transport system substrate-binding protein